MDFDEGVLFIEKSEEKTVSHFNIKVYKNKLIGNEYIIRCDEISPLVFNNYLKYLDQEFNKKNEFIIFSSDFEDVVLEDLETMENDFNEIKQKYILIPK